MANNSEALEHYRKQRALLLRQINDHVRGHRPLGELSATRQPKNIARRLKKRLEQVENLIVTYEKKNAPRR
jgi:hypothetical protein